MHARRPALTSRAPATLRRLLLLCLTACALTSQAAVIQRSIVIDGDISDWRTSPDISTNPDQASTDAEGSSGNCSNPIQPDEDQDCVVQSTGRDLERFAYTFDNTNLYMLVGRYASTSNTTDWWFYLDLDADGLMNASDRVLHVDWKGTNGKTIRTLYAYAPADSNGDPLQDPDTGLGDGYDMPGTVTNGNQLDPNNNAPTGGSTSGFNDGKEMEIEIAWTTLVPSASGPFSVGFHIASSNSTNIPQQLDDNMDGPAGGATLVFSDPFVEKSGPTRGASEFPLQFTITVGNNGPDTALGLKVRDDCTRLATDRPLAAGESLEYATHSVSTGSYDPNDDPADDPDLGAGIWDLGNLAIGTTETLTLYCTVTVDDPVEITNTAELADFKSADTDTSAASNTASNDTPVEVVPLPSLTVLKTSTVTHDPVNGGGNPKRIPAACVEYTVQVVNTGRGEAETVEVSDMLPGGVTLFTGSFASGADECGGTTTTGSTLADSPIEFVPDIDGDDSSPDPLVYDFGGLGDSSDSIVFLDAADAPITPNGGFDPDVATIVVRPDGRLPGQSRDDTADDDHEFLFRYLVRIE